MSGVKGRSGGYRVPKAVPARKPIADAETVDAQEFLILVMQGKIDPSPSQLKAAIAAARNQFATTGKKGAQKQAAAVVATGKFGPAEPPKLVVSNKG